MNPSSPNSATSARRNWMLTGLSLLLLGILLIATVTLSAVGIILIIIGVGTVAAAYIQRPKN